MQNFVVVQNFVLWKTLQLQNGGKIGEIRGALPPREVQPLPAKIQLCALSTFMHPVLSLYFRALPDASTQILASAALLRLSPLEASRAGRGGAS